MRIFRDPNGVTVNAIPQLFDGTNVEGAAYQILHGRGSSEIRFQKGNPAEQINGATNEAVLTMMIHRLEFLESQQPCEENRQALASLNDAVNACFAREARMFRERQAREAAVSTGYLQVA